MISSAINYYYVRQNSVYYTELFLLRRFIFIDSKNGLNHPAFTPTKKGDGTMLISYQSWGLLGFIILVYVTSSIWLLLL